MSYTNPKIHQVMLTDKVRTEAYRDAIMNVVQSTDRVIDFGCGTGILSFFAVDAGAKEVYAIDRTKFIVAAKRIAELNNYTSVKFFFGESSEFTLAEKVDVIVSEWMGHFAFWEQMLDPLILLRNRYLREGGTMIPSRIDLVGGLVTDRKIFEGYSYFREPHYGVDF
jgi:protein arginine N-methyltransferase 1